MDNIYLLVKTDINNVLSLSKKYNLNVASWYWRVKETEDEWINRLVKFSMKRKEVRGYILGATTSITYIIPLESNNDEIVISITKNVQTQEIKTSYAKLYETLEKYLQ